MQNPERLEPIVAGLPSCDRSGHIRLSACAKPGGQIEQRFIASVRRCKLHASSGTRNGDDRNPGHAEGRGVPKYLRAGLAVVGACVQASERSSWQQD
jgi:hypothetical protein